MTRAQLATWIADLRGRLERGELAMVGPVQLRPWSQLDDVERAARRMLESVDTWQATPLEQRRIPGAVEMQRHLAEDLELLYERLVEGKPCPAITWRSQG